MPLVNSGSRPLLQTLRRTNPTAAGGIFDLIDTYTGAKPLREFITQKRDATGRDVLKQAGLSTGNGYIDAPLGIGAEILLDPSSYVTGGVGAAGKAARAAKAVGLLDDAPRLFSRAAINAGKTADLTKPITNWTERATQFVDSVGARAAKTYRKAGIPLNKLTDSDLMARPLVGSRRALRDALPSTGKQMTLRDLVTNAADPRKAADNVSDFMRGGNVERIMDNPLYKDIGFKLPFLPGVGVNLPLAGPFAAKYLDDIGSTIRYSAPGRHVAAKLDKSMLGRSDDVEQLIAKRLTNKEGIKAKEATGKVAELMRSVDQDLIMMAKEGDNARYLRAAVEGNEKYIETLLKNANDPAFKAFKNHRQFDTLVQNIRKFNQGYLDESAKAGIKSSRLTDPFNNQYFSRRLDRKLYPDASKAGIKTNEASVITGDMQARSPEFNIPGGTGMLNQLTRDLAADPALRDADTLAQHIMTKVDEAEQILGKAPAIEVDEVVKDFNGDVIYDKNGVALTQKVMQVPEYTKGSAKELASKLLNMDETALAEGRTLFGQNPMEAIEKYAQGRSKAIGRAEELQSMIAQTAYKGKVGGTSINSSLANLGMESTYGRPLGPEAYRSIGAKQNVVDAINSLAQKGVVDNIQDLGEWRTNAELQKRIKNVSTFYGESQEQGEFFKMLGAITKNFKVWVLATPRRTNRDWYSGMFSNYITHPVAGDQVAGYGIAKRAIIEQDWEGARSMLERIPRYKRIKDAGGDVIRAAQDDLAMVDMAQTGKLRDIDPSGELLESGGDTYAKYFGGDGVPETTAGYRLYDNTIGLLTGSRNPNVSWTKNSAARELMTNKNWAADYTPFEEGITGLAGGKFKARNDFTGLKNPILRTAARTADTTDTINRMGGFYAMLKGGYSPEAAAKAITEAQIDYGSLTNFERKYLQALFPFWSYQSRVVKWGLKSMANSPTFKNVALRTPQRLGDPEGEAVMPSRIEEQYGFPFEIPDEIVPYLEPLLGKEVPGVQLYLSSVDIPFVDSLNTLSPVINPQNNHLSVSKTIGETTENIAGSMLNPLAKMVIEQTSGRDLFTKTPLDATRRSLPTIAGRLGVADAGVQEGIGMVEPAITTVLPGLNHLLSMGRKISTPTMEQGGKSPSVAQNAVEALTNIGTGFKVERIGKEEEVRDMRQKIANYLEQSPYAREMSIPYIPKEQLPFVSDQLLQMYELDKNLQKEQRALRNARLSNPLLTP